jgi:hypothetical protein
MYSVRDIVCTHSIGMDQHLTFHYCQHILVRSGTEVVPGAMTAQSVYRLG